MGCCWWVLEGWGSVGWKRQGGAQWGDAQWNKVESGGGVERDLVEVGLRGIPEARLCGADPTAEVCGSGN